jgi:CheY-like chemotaxis protein
MDSDIPGILIVDDNEDNRYTLQLLLESDGHERIASASGGNEAIALLDKEKFSLVLLDLMMPDLNGDEVLKIIKGNPDTRDIPVVMISADSDTEKVSKCIELGADDYLPKPFNPTILRARIGSALRQGSLRALQSEYVGKMEQAKKDSDSLLRNLFPPEIAARLRNGDSNIADHFEDATVIFADVVGFGKITARMKAYEIVGCLNHLFSEFDRLAEKSDIATMRLWIPNSVAPGSPSPGNIRSVTAITVCTVRSPKLGRQNEARWRHSVAPPSPSSPKIPMNSRRRIPASLLTIWHRNRLRCPPEGAPAHILARADEVIE